MLKVIETENDYKSARTELNDLLERDPDAGTPQADRLGVLALLIENYEKARFSIPLPEPVAAIRFRMEQQGLTQNDLVPYIGSRSKVSEVLSRKRPLSLAMIKALHFGLGIPANVLLQESSEQVPEEQVAWERFPFKEMASRRWIASLKHTTDPGDALRHFFSRAPSTAGSFVFFKKDHIRSNHRVDLYALHSWKTWILIQANERPLKRTYKPGSLNIQYLRELARLSRHTKGPLHAIESLNELGISVIVEPELPKMFIDGAAMMSAYGQPVIGLTLRRDRIDNFWFVLFHELIHVWKHVSSPTNWFFDDVESPAEDKKEQEADECASEALIPMHEWDRSPAKFVRSPDAAKRLAEKLGIHPAVVAGRMRFETKNYKLVTKMVGQGEIKPLFGLAVNRS